MNIYLFLLIFSIIQGLAEVFPISSTGHLAISRQIFNANSMNLALATSLHGGSLIAISIYFRNEIICQVHNFRASLGDLRRWTPGNKEVLSLGREQNVPYLLVLSLIPVALEGLLLRPAAEEIFKNSNLIFIFLIINGIILLLTAIATHGERTIKELSWKEYLLIGIMQGLAVLPGISRLGVVLCTCLWRRLKWQEALRLTFLLAIPVLLGALIVERKEIFQTIGTDFLVVVFTMIGVVLAAISSWFGLKLLTSHLLERRKLSFFGYYCMMFGFYSLLYLYFWS